MSFILLIIKMSENTLQFDNIRVNKKNSMNLSNQLIYI